MRVAVIGLGSAGRIHVKTWKQVAGAELVAVCDVVEENAQTLACLHNASAFTSAQKMFDALPLAAVSICTNPKTHLPLTQLAAAHRVHVLCEKPMASDVDQCQQMIAACQRAQTTLMIAHKQRFAPALVKLWELTRDCAEQGNGGVHGALSAARGQLGPVKFLLMRYPHPGYSRKDWYWRDDDGAGPLLENMVHAADLLQYLCGDVERVYAEGACHFSQEFAPTFSCAVATLKFKSGAIATLGGGFVAHPGISLEDFFVATEEGVATVSGRFDNPDTLRWALRSTPQEMHEEIAQEDTFRAEIEHFVGCIENKTEPRVTGIDGMKAVALCRALIDSSKGERPVNVPAVGLTESRIRLDRQ